MNYDNKNFILAIVLSMLIIFGWQYFYAAPLQKKLTPATETAQTSSRARPRARQPAAGGAVPGTPEAAAATREQALAASPRIKIETDYVAGSINLQGAQIDDLHLLRYRETIDPKSPTITFLSPSGTPGALFAEQGFVPATGTLAKLPDSTTVWTAPAGAVLGEGNPVTLTWDNGEGLVFTPQDRGRATNISSPSPRRSRTRRRRAVARHSLCPHPAPGHAGWSPATGCSSRACSAGSTAACRKSTTRTSPSRPSRPQDRHDRRLAGLHRQVLGGGHHPRPGQARHRQLHPHQGRQPRRLPDGLSRQGRARRAARRHGLRHRPALRRRQGGAHHQRDPGDAQDPGLRLHDRLGLVLFPDQAVVLPARLDQGHRRQFRRRHSHRHRAGQAGGLPARQQVLRLDEQDEEAPARDGEAQGRVSRTTG